MPSRAELPGLQSALPGIPPHDRRRAVRDVPPAPSDHLALPRPPGGIRRWLDAHPRAVDVSLAAAAGLLPAAMLLVVSTDLPSWQLGLSLLLCVVSAGPLLFRRRAPFAVAVLIGLLACLPTPFNSAPAFAAFPALYAMGRYAPVPRVWLGYGVISIATIAATASAGMRLYGPLGSVIGLSNVVFCLVPVLIGISVAGRRRYVDALVARAADLARERDQLAELAVAAERARIARELHDVVSHSLTVMVTLSEGAAAQAEAGTDAAPEAMRRVAATGRESLAEMRRLLGVLRSPEQDAELAPQPTDHDVDALIERFREAGLPVRLTTFGPSIQGPAMRLAVFRILQEGLTNALRHASGARRVEAVIQHEGTRVVVEVTDDARRASSGAGSTGAAHERAPAPGPVPRVPPGRGSGLIGIRERAALHGGTLEVGPLPGGGWRMRATLIEDGAVPIRGDEEAVS